MAPSDRRATSRSRSCGTRTASGSPGCSCSSSRPRPPKSEYRIFRLDEATHSWIDTGDRRRHAGPVARRLPVGRRRPDACGSRPTLPGTVAAVARDDGIRIFKYTYNTATNVVHARVAGFPVTIPNTATVAGRLRDRGGADSVTIDRDSSGRPVDGVGERQPRSRYSISDDGGATWSAAGPGPDAGRQLGQRRHARSTATSRSVDRRSATRSASPGATRTTLPAVDERRLLLLGRSPPAPTRPSAANWSLEKLPTLAAERQRERRQPHQHQGDQRRHRVHGRQDRQGHGQLRHQQEGSRSSSSSERTTGRRMERRTSSARSATATRDRSSSISEQLDTAYVFLTSPNGGGAIYREVGAAQRARRLRLPRCRRPDDPARHAVHPERDRDRSSTIRRRRSRPSRPRAASSCSRTT